MWGQAMGGDCERIVGDSASKVGGLIPTADTSSGYVLHPSSFFGVHVLILRGRVWTDSETLPCSAHHPCPDSLLSIQAHATGAEASFQAAGHAGKTGGLRFSSRDFLLGLESRGM